MISRLKEWCNDKIGQLATINPKQWVWDRIVHLFLLSYRRVPQEANGYSSSVLLTGGKMKLPRDSMYGRSTDAEE